MEETNLYWCDMASVLDFDRYHDQLDRQLLRRIGYTNGLHKIHRFARVIEYLYPIMPTSARVLAQVIIAEENKRTAEGARQLKGSKYAIGIVDVAQALTLIERFGTKLSLSSQGYACHALNAYASSPSVVDAFLLEKTIEADGECTLNILRLVKEGTRDVSDIGSGLMRRLLAIIEFKLQWTSERIDDRFSQRAVTALLTDAQKTLQRAINPVKSHIGKSPVEFFYKHTVSPRLEWLEDLGCLQSTPSGRPTVTESGMNLLSQVQELGGYHADFIFLPLDYWLADYLSLPNLYPDGAVKDFTWHLVASTRKPQPSNSTICEDHAQLLAQIRTLYPAVKLANFNEADALSLYEVFAAREAAEGRLLAHAGFDQALSQLVEEFSSEIFKLSKRRGAGLYVALKGSV
jgi:hypothetical protein